MKTEQRSFFTVFFCCGFIAGELKLDHHRDTESQRKEEKKKLKVCHPNHIVFSFFLCVSVPLW